MQHQHLFAVRAAMYVFAVYFQIAEHGAVEFAKHLVMISGHENDLGARLALPKIVRSTLLCACGQNIDLCMLHTSMMSPTKNSVSISTWCKKSSSRSALHPLKPR